MSARERERMCVCERVNDEDGDGDGVTVGELKDLNDFAFKPWQDLLDWRNRIKFVGKSCAAFF